MKAPWRFPISVAVLLALTAGVSAASAGATSYVGHQALAHGTVMLSVSGGRVAVKDVAISCRKPGSALRARGHGAIADGRFSVKVGYEYYSGRRSAKPTRRWATLTGVLHGARINGALSTSKSSPCSGGRYMAAVAGRVASGEGTSPSTASSGEENEDEASTVPGAPFAENGNYEAAFNTEWEAKIEELCHSRLTGGGEGVQQSAAMATCATLLPPETVTPQQAE
jgi:hypothetical protein